MITAYDKALTDEQVLTLSSIENIASFMPPLYVALCAGDARHTFKRFAKYKRLIGPLMIELSEADDAIEIRMRFDIPGAVMPRFSELSEQLILVSMIRAGTGKHIVPARVRTRYDYGDAITEYLGVLPEKAAENMIAFRVADCELPFITQNNAMTKYLEPELRRRLQELSEEPTFIGMREKTLITAIPGGRFSREQVSQALGVSVRSMQRKLSESGTTFQKELKRVQKMLALAHIDDPKLTLKEVGYLSGYSEQPAFSRAFKGWTGMTITQYKNREK